MISYREEALLAFLQSRACASAEELGCVLRISAKTASEMIKGMNSLLKNYGAEIRPVRSKGYRLKINNEDCFAAFQIELVNIHNAHIPCTPEERLVYLTEQLIFKGLVEIETVCDFLVVTKTELRALLRTLQEEFKPFRVQLVPEGGKYRLCGSIHDLRNLRGMKMYELSYLLNSKYRDKMACHMQLRSILLEIITTHKIFFRQSMLEGMATILTSTFIDCAAGRFCDEDLISCRCNTIEEDFLQASNELCDRIEACFSVTVPQHERCYLALQLMSRCEYNAYLFEKRKPYPEVVEKLAEEINAFTEGSAVRQFSTLFVLKGFLTEMLLRNENRVCPLFADPGPKPMSEKARKACDAVFSASLMPELCFEEQEKQLFIHGVSCMYNCFVDYMSM